MFEGREITKYLFEDRLDYLFNQSPVSRIRVPTGKEAAPEVVLFLPEGDAAKGLDAKVRAAGLAVGYDVVDSKPVLRVRGYENVPALLKRLSDVGVVQGAPTQQSTAEDTPPKQGLVSFIKENSLKLSAGLYILGNTFAITSGILRGGDKAQMAIGGSFMAGDVLMYAFGHKSGEEQYNSVMRRFHTFMKAEQFDIPGGSQMSPSLFQGDGSMSSKVSEFMKDNIVAFKSVTEIAGGVASIKAGMNQNNMKKLAGGAAILTAFGGALMIPERKPAFFREQEQNGVYGQRVDPGLFGGVGEKIQRKPLLFTAPFLLSKNASTIWGALDERKRGGMPNGIDKEISETQGELAALNRAPRNVLTDDKIRETDNKLQNLQKEFDIHDKGIFRDSKKDWLKNASWLKGSNAWKFDIATEASFVAANSLLAMSSKTAGGSGDKLSERLYNVAANMVLAQKPEQKDRALAAMAKFIASQPEVDATEQEALAHISKEVSQLQSHPLLQHSHEHTLAHSNEHTKALADMALAHEKHHDVTPEKHTHQNTSAALAHQALEHANAHDTTPAKWTETIDKQREGKGAEPALVEPKPKALVENQQKHHTDEHAVQGKWSESMLAKEHEQTTHHDHSR